MLNFTSLRGYPILSTCNRHVANNFRGLVYLFIFIFIFYLFLFLSFILILFFICAPGTTCIQLPASL